MTHMMGLGMLAGFAISAVPGAVAFVCIRRTIAGTWLEGVIAGLGGAVGITIFGAISAFGLSALSAFLIKQTLFLRVVSGIYLAYLGIKNYFSEPVTLTLEGSAEPVSYSYTFSSTMFLSIANPVTISLFPFWFAALNTMPETILDGLVVSVSAFCGSALWWLLAATLFTIFKQYINDPVLQKINLGMSILIFLTGVTNICLGFFGS